MGREGIAGNDQQSEPEGLCTDRSMEKPGAGDRISVCIHGRHLSQEELGRNDQQRSSTGCIRRKFRRKPRSHRRGGRRERGQGKLDEVPADT